MSHEVERMFFTGRRPWWFGNQFQGDAIGTYVGEEAITAREAILKAGLDWNVSKRPAAFWDEDAQLWIPCPEDFFLVRDTDKSKLGHCMGKYVPFQNSQVFSFLDSLREGEGLRYHTAGSLKGGAKIWVLAQMPGEFTIGRLSGAVNTHYPFLLVVAGHDGYTGINIMPTDVRAECANTCEYAEMGAQGRKQHWSVAHTASAEAKLRVAASAISEIPRMMAAQQEVLQELARQRMTTDEFIDFATSIFLDVEETDPAEVERIIRKWYEEVTPRSKTIMENKVAEVTNLFLNGNGAEGNTCYDAVTAFTEHFDHKAIQDKVARNLDAAKRVARVQGIVHSAWLGAGAKRKALVLKRLAG
jgi:phage/plasmid-like protein (TIGR03299 family)